jgi:tetratricopeptide (TPR) repeat protein
MNVLPLAEQQQHLEQFRHLLFHLQMECGSIHHLFRFFKDEVNFKHFDALKEIDPKLMLQLLAREYVLEARKAENLQQARQHLETALQLDPHCPEACLELASLSDSPEASMMWYQKSMDATKALLGERRRTELMAAFRSKPWQQVETHTYFKAKVNLAEKLFRTGYYEVAVLHFQELLALDPKDDLHLRHYLLTALLCENRQDEATQLIRQYPDDLSAFCALSRRATHAVPGGCSTGLFKEAFGCLSICWAWKKCRRLI